MNGQPIPALMNVVPRVDRLRFNQLRCYTCIQCGRSFEKKQSLKRHITDKHVTKISCDFCGYKVGASRRSLMDRHLLLKHRFPVAVSQRQETTMEMAPTLPELETPSTDAITLEDQPMESLIISIHVLPCLLPLALSLLPLPPLLNLARPSPYTQLTWICNPQLGMFPPPITL